MTGETRSVSQPKWASEGQKRARRRFPRGDEFGELSVVLRITERTSLAHDTVAIFEIMKLLLHGREKIEELSIWDKRSWYVHDVSFKG